MSWQVLVFILFGLSWAQRPSPCPGVFDYRGKEEDRWYGVITATSPEDLTGIWLRIILDRPAELLGNWFGDATSSDNTEYLIRSPKFKLEAGVPQPIRFFVKYNAANIIPSVTGIRLNGKNICQMQEGIEEPQGSTPTLHLSVSSSTTTSTTSTTTRRPSRRPTQSSIIPEDNQSNFGGLSNQGDNSNFFQGDRPTFQNQNQNSNRPLLPSGVQQNRNVACGTAKQRPSPLITNGQATVPGQWPWHVAFFHSQGRDQKYICGGTLISHSHVITAAHCVARPQTNRPVEIEKLQVQLGKFGLDKFHNGVQYSDIEDIHLHPEYNSTFYYNDIAIVKLTKRVDFTDYVRPCCLWEGNTQLSEIIQELGTVVGWGFTEENLLSDSLMQTQMPIASEITCLTSNRQYFSQILWEKNFCAGFRNGTSVCNGDSGGGLFLPRTGNGVGDPNTTWQLRGIVSVGVGLQGLSVCDPHHYAVFTDAAKYVDWIRGIVRQ